MAPRRAALRTVAAAPAPAASKWPAMAAATAPARFAEASKSNLKWRRAMAITAAVLATVAATAGLISGPQRTDETLADDAPAINPATATAPEARCAALQHQIARYPRDNRARVLKARLDVQTGRCGLAVGGYRVALAAAPKVARDAGVWVELDQAQGLRMGGRYRQRSAPACHCPQPVERELHPDAKMPTGCPDKQAARPLHGWARH